MNRLKRLQAVFSILFLLLAGAAAWAEGLWTQVNPANPPSPRDGHVMQWMPDDQVLIFGGQDETQAVLNDLYSYDPDRMTVTALPQPAINPPARSHAASCVVNGKLLLQGGKGPAGQALNDLWIYDPAQNTWGEIAPSGPGPAPHYAHTATLLPDGKVALVGGKDNSGAPTQDFWMYDPADQTFAQGPPVPVPVWEHKAFVVESILYVMAPGSMPVYDTNRGRWTTHGELYPNRGYCVIPGINDQGDAVATLFGGEDAHGVATDAIYEYNLKTGSLTRKPERMPFPVAYAAQALAGAQSAAGAGWCAIFFGGVRNAVRHNKMVQYINPPSPSGLPGAWPRILKDFATGAAAIGSLDIQSVTTVPEIKKILVTTRGELVIFDVSSLQTVVESEIPFVSQPSQITDAGNGNYIFRADDGAHGSELWTYNAATQSAELFADLAPGAPGGALPYEPMIDPSNAPPNVVYYNGFAYTFSGPPAPGVGTGFAALTRVKSKTETTLIKKFRDSPQPRDLKVQNGKMFFSGSDGSGRQLWVSDGTPEGTKIVKRINPAEPQDSLYEKPFLTPGVSNASGAPAQGLYFTATDGATGWGLYFTDGTENGTARVKSFSPTYPPLQSIATPGGQVFIAHDGATGYEPWITDGTEAGTRQLANLTTNDAGLAGNYYRNYAPDYVYITNDAGLPDVLFMGYNDNGYNSLYATNGTPEGTRVVYEATSASNSVVSATGVNGWVSDEYPARKGAIFSTTGRLMKTDAQSPATTIQSFPEGYPKAPPSNLANLGDDVWFSANMDPYGTELWTSKPPYEEASTQMAVDAGKDKPPASKMDWNYFDPTGDTWAKSAFLPMAAMIWTYVNMEANLIYDSNSGIWDKFFMESDGTPQGTGPYLQKPPQAPKQTAPGFSSAAGDEGEPYTFDNIYEAVALDYRMIFVADDGVHGLEPWVADGSLTGTQMLKDICPFNTQSAYRYIEGGRFLTPFRGKVYFAAIDIEDPAQWAEHLWETDGTTSGTRAIAPVDFKNPKNFCVVGETLYFTAQSDTQGWELFKSDGTAAGTTIVRNIQSGSSSSQPQNLTACGDRVFFTAYQTGVGRELWVSDGSQAGTALVKDITPPELDATWYNRPGRIGNLVCMNGLVFFAADNGTSGTELWRSDGTAAGTWLVKDIWPGAGASNPERLTVISGPSPYLDPEGGIVDPGDILYFTATSPGCGRELWKSDGTPEGTALVKDIVSGAGSSLPAEITRVGLEPGLAFFSAYTPETGRELWITDGTEAGTRLFADIYPGPESSKPRELNVRFMRSAMDYVLFFASDDGSHGAEPWVINPALPAAPSRPSAWLFR